MEQKSPLTPRKYQQPTMDFIGRTMDGELEAVDYVPHSHLRIWYNNQIEGYEQHHHHALEIILCIENPYTVTTGGRDYCLNAGDILFIPPDMLHSISGGEGSRFVFQIDLSPLSVFMDFNAIEPILMNPLFLDRSSHLYDSITAHLKEITDIYFQNPNMWELSIFSILLKLFTELGQDNFEQKDSFRPDSGGYMVNYEKFASLLKHIDTHYSEDLTLDWAANYAGFSKYHFLRLFKEYTGTTYHDHLSHKRIQAAQQLLSTDETVSNIASYTGFNNLTSFCRCFKKYTGMSPSEYRGRKEQLV
ncbi:MAG: AraC family transcriptional regulator [Lachnospiraceae bacterium]|nr:AraC family transcriptional regulator [Lachnospiraceae bacterium]